MLGGLNTYAYANLNPLKYADPTGEIVDTLVDAGFIIYDIYRIVRDNVIGQCDNLAENSAALGADVAGLLTPFATGLGVAVRGGLKVIKPGEALKAYKANKDFRRWFHKEYKPDVAATSRQRHNPNVDIEDGYAQWLGEGRPRVK